MGQPMSYNEFHHVINKVLTYLLACNCIYICPLYLVTILNSSLCGPPLWKQDPIFFFKKISFYCSLFIMLFLQMDGPVLLIIFINFTVIFMYCDTDYE